MKQIHILLVEDNEADIFITTEALEQKETVNKISVARDGVEAINFMERGALGAENQNLPDLVLLDINLPKKNGHEVLKYIKNSDRLRHVPVIMLSTSSAESDIRKAYANHANCFITKPVEIGDFFLMINAIENFWFSIVKLPVNAVKEQLNCQAK